MPTELKHCPEMSAAIREHDLPRLREAFINFPDLVDIYTPFGAGTWLHFAAREGAFEIVKYLLDYGFDINEGDKDDDITPLCSACQGGHYEIVKYLLDHGAVMDTSASVRNPLFAAISGSIQVNALWGAPTGEAPQIVRLLLERGIDSKVRYNTKTMKDMDAVAFAMLMGAGGLARIVALWNEGGDEAKAQAAIEEGLHIARANTKPIPPGEQVAPS